MKKNSCLIVEYLVQDSFELPFDLNTCYKWMVEFGTLYVKHHQDDENYVEYSPTLNSIKDDPEWNHFPRQEFLI